MRLVVELLPLDFQSFEFEDTCHLVGGIVVAAVVVEVKDRLLLLVEDTLVKLLVLVEDILVKLLVLVGGTQAFVD